MSWIRKSTCSCQKKQGYFWYGWSGGKLPGYVPDVRSAALGGYGADENDNLIETGAGENIITQQLKNYYALTG